MSDIERVAISQNKYCSSDYAAHLDQILSVSLYND